MMDILFEDEDLLVVVKPPGVPSQKDPTGDEDLYSMVRAHVGSTESLGLIQRLDRPVGGLMVLSKSHRASKGLTEAVKEHRLDKHYLALVTGAAQDSAHLEHWIQKVRGNRALVSMNKTAACKTAVLDYTCIRRYTVKDGPVSLLEVKLHTGRHHQIRAQMAFVKLPLVGDTKYNPAYQKLTGWYEIGLYAYKLRFDHPVTGEKMGFEVMPEGEPWEMIGKRW